LVLQVSICRHNNIETCFFGCIYKITIRKIAPAAFRGGDDFVASQESDSERSASGGAAEPTDSGITSVWGRLRERDQIREAVFPQFSA
jgi:hypothetical protein